MRPIGFFRFPPADPNRSLESTRLIADGELRRARAAAIRGPGNWLEQDDFTETYLTNRLTFAFQMLRKARLDGKGECARTIAYRISALCMALERVTTTRRERLEREARRVLGAAATESL